MVGGYYYQMKKLAWGCLLLTLFACGGGGGTAGTASYEVVAIGGGFNQPIQFKTCPASATIDYVIERTGVIRTLVSGVVQPTAALDISTQFDLSGETGLLGVALHPNFATNRYLFVYAVKTSPLESLIIRYTASPDFRTFDAGSAHRVFTLNQEPHTNHKGGTINFGPDGYLYLGLGDGGSGNDPDGNGQNPNTLLGKMIRLDVDGDAFPVDSGNNYGIPSTNPFFTSTFIRKEIWSFGLRNPFRWSFDSSTGGQLIADVGQGAWEEINYEPANRGGRNYGWRIREGKHDSGLSGTPPSGTTIYDPFIEYDHVTGSSITGGFVVRTTTLDELRNHYLFADFVSNRMWHAPLNLSGGEANNQTMGDATEIIVPGGWGGIVSIDPDRNGDPVICELGGRVGRLVHAPTP